MIIGGCSINDYWCDYSIMAIVVIILLMVIDDYFINGYWCDYFIMVIGVIIQLWLLV
jgi:hypothetical protein